MTNIRNFIFGLCLLALAMPVLAREYRPSSLRSFDDSVARKELVIVMFYHENSQINRVEELGDLIKNQKEDFHSASMSMPLVGFVSVNTTKDRLQELDADYNIHQVPIFILFRNGEPYQENGKIVQRVGFLSRREITQFVRNHFKDFIEDILEERREEARERARNRVYGGVYFGYPYPWGWYYPYYGPYWGPQFYFGW